MAKRIAIVGVGGIGGCIGAYLIRSGHDVTLIDQWGQHVETMRRDGLTVSTVEERFTVPVKTALHLSDVSRIGATYDLVFLSVKSYDTVWQTHLIAPYLSPSGCVLPAMNALNDETVAQIVGYPRTVGCVTTISAGIYEPGHVVRTDPLTTHAFTIGELSGLITPRVNEAVAMLSVLGPSAATHNIWGARWSKLVWNSMGNALAGMLGADVATLTPAQDELANTIRVMIGIEATRVAAAVGVSLDPVRGIPAARFAAAGDAAAVAAVRAELVAASAQRDLAPEQLARLPQPGRPSLAQDVLKGRRTEVDYLNGEIVRHGQVAGVPTPMNQAVVALMHRIERGEFSPGAGTLEVLRPHIVY